MQYESLTAPIFASLSRDGLPILMEKAGPNVLECQRSNASEHFIIPEADQ